MNNNHIEDRGKIEFPTLSFTKPGVYRYTIRELTPSSDRWKSDSREFTVVVTVVLNEQGELVATVDYSNGFPKFVNRRIEKPCCCDCRCNCCRQWCCKCCRRVTNRC